MYKKNIQDLDYCEKTQILKTIFNEYQKAKEKLSQYPTLNHSPLFIREKKSMNDEYEHHLLNTISKMNHYREYIEFLDMKIQYLNETEKLIIEHDFIKHSSKNWWYNYFSSATYYRHKKKAIERLISLLFS